MTGAIAATTVAGTDDGAKIDFFAPQGTTFDQQTSRSSSVTTASRWPPEPLSTARCLVHPDHLRLVGHPRAPRTSQEPASDGYGWRSRPVLRSAGPGELDGAVQYSVRRPDGRHAHEHGRPHRSLCDVGESSFGFSTPAQADSPVIDPAVGGGGGGGGIAAGRCARPRSPRFTATHRTASRLPRASDGRAGRADGERTCIAPVPAHSLCLSLVARSPQPAECHPRRHSRSAAIALFVGALLRIRTHRINRTTSIPWGPGLHAKNPGPTR